LVSGEIRPGDEPKLNASATAVTNHNQRRGSGVTSTGRCSARIVADRPG
jgi:hypothetical protein